MLTFLGRVEGSQRKDVSGEKSVFESSLIFNSFSAPKDTVNDLMNTRDVYHFPSFQPSFIGGKFITKCSESEK